MDTLQSPVNEESIRDIKLRTVKVSLVSRDSSQPTLSYSSSAVLNQLCHKCNLYLFNREIFSIFDIQPN